MPCAVSPMNAAGVVLTTFSPKLLQSITPGSSWLPDTSSHLFTLRTAQRLCFSLCFMQRLVGSLLTTHGRHQIRPVSFPEPCSLRRQNHQAQSSGCQHVGLKP